MANTFSVTLPPNTTVAQATAICQQKILAAGGRYAFDGTNGSFAVKGVSGTFSVYGMVIAITINSKPWIVTNAYVENAVRGFFQQV
jgi:hypothetical protein